MRRKLLRTLLVAATLLVGANAWGTIYQGRDYQYDIVFGNPSYTDSEVTGVDVQTDFTTDYSEQNYTTMSLVMEGSVLAGNQATNGRTYSLTNPQTTGTVTFKATGKFVGGAYNFFHIYGAVEQEGVTNNSYQIIASPYDLPRNSGSTTVLRIFGENIEASYVYTPRDVLYGYEITIDLDNQKIDYKITYASDGRDSKVSALSTLEGTFDVPEGIILKDVQSFHLPRCGQNGSNYYDNVAFYSSTSYSVLYSAAKAEYDTKAANLDAAGQTYWSSNVIPASSVTTAASYSTAIAALPTTYVSAVKAQTTPGSDMTAAMNTEIAASSWTNATGTYQGVAAERYNGDTPYSTGKTLYQTVSGLHAGYYKVKFYGVANVARNLDSQYYGSGIAQVYANDETLDIDVIYQDACSPISDSYLREFEVYLPTDDSSIEFGIKNIAEGGQWYVAQALSLNYLGTEKIAYTINAVAGETTISQLATGTEWASNTYGTFIPYVINYNNKYYILDDADNSNLDGYYASYTMGASAETKAINYTLDESIVYFYDQTTAGTNYSYTNGTAGYVASQNARGGSPTIRGIGLITLGSGNYEFITYFTARNGRGLGIRDNDNPTDPIFILTTDKNDAQTGGLRSGSFTLYKETSCVINGANSGDKKANQSEDFDYIIIRKTLDVITKTSSANLQGYKTFYNADKAFQVDDNTTIYTAATPNGTTVTITPVTGKIIPAGKPVILKTTNSDDYKIVLTETSESSTDDFTSNVLLAATASGTIADAYILAYTTVDGLGFYPYSASLDAGDVYLTYAANPAHIRIVFDDDTVTGISNVKDADSENGAMFNLSGQRVNNGYKGIVIKNGKKYLVK